MKYTMKDLGAYKLHMINTDKFNTISVKVLFYSPIVKEEITYKNVLAGVLFNSSKKYKTKRELSIAREELYNAIIGSSHNRYGNYDFLNFTIHTLSDKYTEKGNFKKCLEYLNEIIFNPNVKDNKFLTKELDVVKNKNKNAIESIKESTGTYAKMRINEEMSKGMPSSYRSCGYIEDLEKINEENLYSYYKEMLRKSLVDIIIVGDIDENETLEEVKSLMKLRTIKKKKDEFKLAPVKARLKVNTIKELIDTKQSKLVMGYRLYGIDDEDMKYTFNIFNLIFGGGCDSKLFTEVREENSLCYTIRSIFSIADSNLFVLAGIDRGNFDKVVSLVGKKLDDMKKGKFTEEDIKVAKEYIDTSYDVVFNSTGSILDFYEGLILFNPDDLETRKKKFNNVTKKDIVRVAKKVKLDTVYLLEGGK